MTDSYRGGDAVRIGDLFARDPLFARPNEIAETRPAVCECGAEFTQQKLSDRFVGIVERFSAGAKDALLRQSPDLFVPVHCPKCERADVERWSRMAEFNTDPELRLGL